MGRAALGSNRFSKSRNLPTGDCRNRVHTPFLQIWGVIRNLGETMNILQPELDIGPQASLFGYERKRMICKSLEDLEASRQLTLVTIWHNYLCESKGEKPS